MEFPFGTNQEQNGVPVKPCLSALSRFCLRYGQGWRRNEPSRRLATRAAGAYLGIRNRRYLIS